VTAVHGTAAVTALHGTYAIKPLVFFFFTLSLRERTVNWHEHYVWWMVTLFYLTTWSRFTQTVSHRHHITQQ